MTVAPDALAALRHRLHEMRAKLVAQLAAADVLDGGLLALLGNVGIALLALDEVAVPEAGGRGGASTPAHARTRDRRRGGDPRSGRRR